MEKKMQTNWARESTVELEARAGHATKHKLSGLAIPYNSLSDSMWGSRERILPGAFAKSLEEGDQFAFWAHDDREPLALRSAGNLEFEDTESGVLFAMTPSDTERGRTFLTLVKDGVIKHMSFGFFTKQDRWITEEDGLEIREIMEAELVEISPVSRPAYPQTGVQLQRKLDVFQESRAAAGLTPLESESYGSGMSGRDHRTVGPKPDEVEREQIEARMAQKRKRLEELEA